MSRFDEWAKTSAQGESPLRAWRRSRRTRDAAPTAAGIDRRELLKKATIVGGATLFAAPLIQTVATPAFAAPTSAVCAEPGGCGTGPGCLPCADAAPCQTASDCLSGVCSKNGICAISDGGTCQGANAGAMNQNCKSGKCGPNGCLLSSGAVCLANSECASGKCENAAKVGNTPGTCK